MTVNNDSKVSAVFDASKHIFKLIEGICALPDTTNKPSLDFVGGENANLTVVRIYYLVETLIGAI